MFKTVFAVVGFVVILGTVLTCAGVGNQSATPGPAATPVVTLAEFEKVEVGMSLDEAARIIGARGVEQSRNELAGTVTVLVEWRNADLSAMNAIFQGGKLVQKSQVGLK
jgi:hypothetical protein